jgi:hypothetical protein
MIVFELDTSALDRLGVRLADVLEVRAGELNAAAGALVVGMILRTQGGRGQDGRFFKPYAASTEADRSKRGRSTKPVTLSDTGAMLASIQHRIEGDRAVVYFVDARIAERAAWLHEGTQRMPARPWFGFSQRDLDTAGALIAARIAARIGAMP